MVYWSVDRVEEGQAILEGPDGSWMQRSLSELPPQIKEGDCLFQNAGEWQIDPEETQRRRKEMAQRLRAVFGKGCPDSAQEQP